MNEEAWNADQVKAFIEAILVEKDRALAMADNERELAASALRGEQQRALDQASRERDKAAENLRIELARAIHEGDERLREHISNQIMQINAALVSAEKLEKERLSRVDSIIIAQAEKLEVLRSAQVLGQQKFETSVEGRFAQVNEFRGSLDDLSKQMATRRELEAMAIASNAKIDELNITLSGKIDEAGKQMAEMRSRLDIGPTGLSSLQSYADQSRGRQAAAQISTGLFFSGLAALATIISIVMVLTRI